MKPKFQAKVAGKKILAPHTLALTLNPDIRGFKFIAGQYIGVWLSNVKGDKLGSVRSFSMVNDPRNRILEIAFREGVSPYKKALQKLKKGAEVLIEGPYGQFTLHEDRKRPALFLIGGVGIAPVLSMLQDPESRNYKITLLYSNKSLDNTPYVKTLERLEKKRPNLKTILTMSEDPKWVGHKGRISLKLIKQYLPKSAVVYVVGKPDMVADMKALLNKLKVANTDIKTEVFTGY